MIQPIRLVSDSFGAPRHEFLQADGRWQRCGGKGFCRECNRAADKAKAK